MAFASLDAIADVNDGATALEKPMIRRTGADMGDMGRGNDARTDFAVYIRTLATLAALALTLFVAT